MSQVACDLTTGTYGLKNAMSLATHMGQLQIKRDNLDLNRMDTKQYLENFPGDWEVEFLEFEAPSDFVPSPSQPHWCPGNIVRSYKCQM